jgi:hypothetical protein
LLTGVGGINKFGTKLEGVSGSTMRCRRTRTGVIPRLLVNHTIGDASKKMKAPEKKIYRNG